MPTPCPDTSRLQGGVRFWPVQNGNPGCDRHIPFNLFAPGQNRQKA
jgi:hypothetical protein